MSIDNGTRQLSFPLRAETPADDILIVRDIDLVGVGALRRHQMEILQASKQFILRTYERNIPSSVFSIYQAELLRTLQWLRPYKTEVGERFDFVAEQKKLFSILFPETEKTLGFTAARVRDQYLQDMEWSSWLLQDHWRYFVGYLRQKFPENTLLSELAHWEWVQAWIEIQPFEALTIEDDFVALNPSLQIVSLTQDIPALKRDRGMYAFVYSDRKATVVERPLDIFEAQIIDLLHEDRKYTKIQLLEMAALSDKLASQPSLQEWEKKFLSLQGDDILQVQN